jgi:DNA-binding MarR family transcriptional regulator
MGLSLSRASRVIDRLCSHDFVRRSDCAADRRCRSLCLTRQGAKVRERIETMQGECEDRILEDYSGARMAGLKKDLKDLAAAFSSE